MSMDEQEDHDGLHSRASASRRTRSQCRRKWDSLLSKYKEIKLWESSESLVESYWLIDYERRCEFGFLEDFDFEVFKAIDDHLKVGDGSDTDPDVDPEVVADGVAEPGLNVNSCTLLNPEEKFILELVNRNKMWFSTKNWDFAVKYRFYDRGWAGGVCSNRRWCGLRVEWSAMGIVADRGGKGRGGRGVRGKGREVITCVRKLSFHGATMN
ncbi:hypothetical protein TEA_028200 [Camellia sinensis var. sinensis]|uniref:Myb-like domain-containing protein n=1 Tax=Camellia sinensis var. sinensis TaxID=542762 RepID=A0A4S4DEZ6_CAMSN|nr:hypothetical protein TEA_028200 [Camellia sinensis var. sinensis]